MTKIKANIIAGVNRKGGSGKTTLIYNLAGIVAQTGDPVTILDSDPQKSLFNTWKRRREDIPIEVIPVDEDFDLEHEAFFRKGFVFIDTPPVNAKPIRRALVAANLVLIPIKPSFLDLWASLPLFELAKEAREVNPSLKTIWVINQAKKRTIVSQVIRDAAVEKEGLPVADTAIPDSIVLVESMAYGIPLCFYQKNNPIVDIFKTLLTEIHYE